MCTILVSTYYTTCPSYLKRNQFFQLAPSFLSSKFCLRLSHE
ncbi:hypothetical protein PNI0010_00594 [Streptococcus pneumoniae PNI0010]|nr:hypothetical protein PNI0010_00594 [Streptococcus pneumoniae PNI0010]